MSLLLLGILNSQVVSGPSGPLAGYVATGTENQRVATVDKFLFPTDTRTTLATGVSQARASAVGFASTLNGYVAGGLIDGPTYVTTVDKFNLTDDTRSTLATGLSGGSDEGASASSSTAGYITGGRGALTNTANKFSFANDARTTLTSWLGETTEGMAGFQSATSGYFVGGYTSDISNKVDRLNFSTDARTRLGSTLGAARYIIAGASHPSWTIAYVAGGYGAGFAILSSVEKFFFSTETFTTLGTGLTQGTIRPAPFASLTHAYFAGGELSSGRTATVAKFDISNDSRTTTSLSATRKSSAGFAGQ